MMLAGYVEYAYLTVSGGGILGIHLQGGEFSGKGCGDSESQQEQKILRYLHRPSSLFGSHSKMRLDILTLRPETTAFP